jgi:CRP-like cAMP-binding protein
MPVRFVVDRESLREAAALSQSAEPVCCAAISQAIFVLMMARRVRRSVECVPQGLEPTITSLSGALQSLSALNHAERARGCVRRLCSEEVGTLPAGSRVHIVEQRRMADSSHRVCVVLVGTNRPLGWLTFKLANGELGVRLAGEDGGPPQLEDESAQHDVSDPAPVVVTVSPTRKKSPTRKEEDPFKAIARRSLLMRHLDAAELTFVASNARLSEYEAGSVVYGVGDMADYFYVVSSGTFQESEPHPSGEGTRPKRRHTAVGAPFGSHELLFGGLRKTSVVATDNGGAAWAIPKRVFDAKIKLSPAPAKEMLTFLSSVPLLSKLMKAELTQLARAGKEIRVNVRAHSHGHARTGSTADRYLHRATTNALCLRG